MSVFALVDCNNFYVSCERVFNPNLEKKPIVVLSNNDGCIISRSAEAKKLGIPMGAPFFKWERCCAKHGVEVLSSNFELYGDMSDRVMSLLQDRWKDTEIYSIDEAFLDLKRGHFNSLEFATDLAHSINQWLGLPVSIGIGSTKTLAKIATSVAKEKGCSVLSLLDKEKLENILNDFPIQKIWGVGNRLSQRLNQNQIFSAKDLRESDATTISVSTSISVEKTILELRGISCYSLNEQKPRQQIIVSRSFGKSLIELSDIEAAISHFAIEASLKLRKQDSVVGLLTVFLQTNYFQKNAPQYENGVEFRFPIPTDYTPYLLRIAKKSLQTIFRPGYKYHKVGVILSELSSKFSTQMDFFTEQSEKQNRLMEFVDRINNNFGKNTVFYAAEKVSQQWQPKSEKTSPNYTTDWNNLIEVT